MRPRNRYNRPSAFSKEESPVRILAVETSGPRGGIALAEETAGAVRLIDEVLLAEGLRHGRDIVLNIKEACGRAGWNLPGRQAGRRQIPLVAVSIGPGSFTGIRIAVTLAKIMAWETSAKVVAVPSFRALAANAPADRPRVVTVFDAKRGGVFASIFERAQAPGIAGGSPRGLAPESQTAGAAGPSPRHVGGFLSEVFGPAMLSPEALAARLASMPPAAAPAYIIGHGIGKSSPALAGCELAPPEAWDIRPSAVARLGLEMAAAGEFTDPLHLEPLYIRLPEAEEIWEKRHRQDGRRNDEARNPKPESNTKSE
jgi:tRNA threonylcarbamoyladenosine biosynthesis protein TsaB